MTQRRRDAPGWPTMILMVMVAITIGYLVRLDGSGRGVLRAVAAESGDRCVGAFYPTAGREWETARPELRCLEKSASTPST
jgi:hypothetical protein